LLSDVVKEAEVRRLLKYKESFGTNHSIENCLITVEWMNQAWDTNDDPVDFEADSIEPPAPARDCA